MVKLKNYKKLNKELGTNNFVRIRRDIKEDVSNNGFIIGIEAAKLEKITKVD